MNKNIEKELERLAVEYSELRCDRDGSISSEDTEKAWELDMRMKELIELMENSREQEDK